MYLSGLGKAVMTLPLPDLPKCQNAKVQAAVKFCGDKKNLSASTSKDKRCAMFYGSGNRYRTAAKLPKCVITLTPATGGKKKSAEGGGGGGGGDKTSADHPETIGPATTDIETAAIDMPTTAAPEPMSDTMKYGLIGGGVLVLGVAAFLLLGGKKKTATPNASRYPWTSKSYRKRMKRFHKRRRARRARGLSA